MKKIIIMGATSGLGRGVAERFIAEGWTVGVAGRNSAALDELKAIAPERVITSVIDITADDAAAKFDALIDETGGMDIYFHASGVLRENEDLSEGPQLQEIDTNVAGLTRMVSAAYRYFRRTGKRGRIVVISSIAGIRGVASLPSYAGTKAYDSTYLEALRQRARHEKLPISIVDIKPGYVRTPLLNPDKKYFLEMDPDKAVKLIYKATLRAKRTCVIGLHMKILTFIERITPSFIWERMYF